MGYAVETLNVYISGNNGEFTDYSGYIQFQIQDLIIL